MTSLVVSVVRSGEELIHILIDAGADKEARTSDGKTAYDYAVEHDRPSEVTVLLKP